MSLIKQQFVSYSQHADDYIAWQLLGKKNDGLVIEVGAFDGIHLSNSFSLEKLGWKSICVEPNPTIFTCLTKNRPLSTNINAAIVSDASLKTVEFFAEEIGVLSGCVYNEEDIKKRYRNRGIEYNSPRKLEVPAATMNSILEAHKIKPKQIDLISIDVEGFEMAVLEGFDVYYYKPSLFIIEANTLSDADQLIKYFGRFKQYSYLGANLQNLFFLIDDKISRKVLRNLDFKDFLPATQIHPFDQRLAIQAVPPLFNQSPLFKRLTKSWLSKLF